MLLLSAGNTNDIGMARALVEAAGPARRLIADRGYDAAHLRDLLAARGTEAVIPSTMSRRVPIPYDRAAYRARNLVERMWCRLKDWRRVATRYDKLGRNFLASAHLAAIFTFWLNRVRSLGRRRETRHQRVDGLPGPRRVLNQRTAAGQRGLSVRDG